MQASGYYDKNKEVLHLLKRDIKQERLQKYRTIVQILISQTLEQGLLIMARG
jgi:hypothetical protein